MIARKIVAFQQGNTGSGKESASQQCVTKKGIQRRKNYSKNEIKKLK